MSWVLYFELSGHRTRQEAQTPDKAVAKAMTKINLGILASLLGRHERRSESAVKLVIGLGNPGKRYSDTRHNVGFWCVDRLATQTSIALSKRYSLAHVGEGTINGHLVALAKPRTFMNDSGRAITSILARYRALPENMIVVHDDMNLPLGKLRLRTQGSVGGHNGMKSIIGAIGTQEFVRLRIGIGSPPVGVNDVDYVLGRMTADEHTTAKHVVGRAAEAIVCVLTEDIDTAMNQFN